MQRISMSLIGAPQHLPVIIQTGSTQDQLLLAVIGYYVIVEIKTKKALKEKKSADRKAAKAAAKKSKSAKKKPKSRK